MRMSSMAWGRLEATPRTNPSSLPQPRTRQETSRHGSLMEFDSLTTEEWSIWIWISDFQDLPRFSWTWGSKSAQSRRLWTLTQLLHDHLEVGFSIRPGASERSTQRLPWSWASIRAPPTRHHCAPLGAAGHPQHGSGPSPKTTPPNSLPTWGGRVSTFRGLDACFRESKKSRSTFERQLHKRVLRRKVSTLVLRKERGIFSRYQKKSYQNLSGVTICLQWPTKVPWEQCWIWMNLIFKIGQGRKWLAALLRHGTGSRLEQESRESERLTAWIGWLSSFPRLYWRSTSTLPKDLHKV